MSRQFQDLRLGCIELFCLTAQHLSFTAAAKSAGLTAAAVSRSVTRLEGRLGKLWKTQAIHGTMVL